MTGKSQKNEKTKRRIYELAVSS